MTFTQDFRHLSHSQTEDVDQFGIVTVHCSCGETGSYYDPDFDWYVGTDVEDGDGDGDGDGQG